MVPDLLQRRANRHPDPGGAVENALPHTLPGLSLAHLAMIGWLVLVGCGTEGPGRPWAAGNPTDAHETAPLELTVMTFNVMCSFCGGLDDDPWAQRVQYQADVIARHDPDLIGLQEFVFSKEVDQYLALNPGYAAVFYVSADHEFILPSYPDETILYRKDRFAEIARGFFWLSPTPDKPFSVGFLESGRQLPRLVGWVLLEQRSDGRRFYFANTHFDPNHPSQEKSVPLVYERFSDMVFEHPLILAGDFNLDPGEDGFIALCEGMEGHPWHFVAAYDIAQERSVVTNLVNPGPLDDRGRGIDLILLAGADFECPYWKVDYSVYGDKHRFPSDHFAISARVVVR